MLEPEAKQQYTMRKGRTTQKQCADSPQQVAGIIKSREYRHTFKETLHYFSAGAPPGAPPPPPPRHHAATTRT
jgi:hypothetical protein